LAYLFVRNVPGSFGALYQDVTTISAGTYTLTVAAAKEAFVPPTVVPLNLHFEAVSGASSVFLSGNDFPVGATNTATLTDLSVNLNVPVGSPQIGNTLRIVIGVSGQDAGGNPNDPRATYDVDNVRLDFSAIPEPHSLSLLAAGAVGLVVINRGRYRGRL
jgi:hypothetical protein